MLSVVISELREYIVWDQRLETSKLTWTGMQGHTNMKCNFQINHQPLPQLATD